MDPTLVSAAVTIAKAGGPKAATAAFRRAYPNDWAERLAKAACAPLGRPRPTRRLARFFRGPGMLERLAAAFSLDGSVVDEGLVDEVAGVLGGSFRWHKLAPEERLQRAQELVTRLLNEFVASLPPSRAVAVTHNQTMRALSSLDEKVEGSAAVLASLSQQQTADSAAGQLSLFSGRLDSLPAVAKAPLGRYFEEDPQGVDSVVLAITDTSSLPDQTLKTWVASPPAWLGTPQVPIRPAAWACLGELCAAYGLAEDAATAFAAVIGAGGRRPSYFRARRAWASIQADRLDEAGQILHDGPDARSNAEPAFRTMAAVYETIRPGTTPEADALAAARYEITAWAAVDDVDRDLRARLAALVELMDPDHDDAEQYTAAIAALDDALEVGWIDDTAVAAAR